MTTDTDVDNDDDIAERRHAELEFIASAYGTEEAWTVPSPDEYRDRRSRARVPSSDAGSGTAAAADSPSPHPPPPRIHRRLVLPGRPRGGSNDDEHGSEGGGDGVHRVVVELVLTMKGSYPSGDDEGSVLAVDAALDSDARSSRSNRGGSGGAQIVLRRLAMDALPGLLTACREVAADSPGAESALAVLGRADEWVDDDWRELLSNRLEKECNKCASNDRTCKRDTDQCSRRATSASTEQQQQPSGLNELHLLMGLPRSTKRKLFSDDDLRSCGDADWDAVSRHLSAHPGDAARGIKWGRYSTRRGAGDGALEQLPLATSLLNRAAPVPLHVVRTFLKAFSDSIRTGRCPLEAALTNPRTSLDIWRILFQSAARTDRSRLGAHLREMISRDRAEQPLTDAIGEMIQFVPEALDRRDPELPIRGAIELFDCVSPATVRLLIQEGMKRNVGGKNGAGGLFAPYDSPSGRTGRAGYRTSKSTILDNFVSRVDAKLRSFQGRSLSENVRDNLVVCFKAAGAAKLGLPVTDIDDYPAAHGAIQFAPMRVVEALMLSIACSRTRLFDHSNSLTDPSGRTPLHFALIAAGTAMKRRGNDAQSSGSDWREFIPLFLGGGRERIRDIEGRLPLHVAIEEGVDLEYGLDLVIDAYPEASTCSDLKGQLPLHGAVSRRHLKLENGLERVLDANPGAAAIPDLNGQLPFHVAVEQGYLAWETGLECVFRAYPEAGMRRDTKSGMDPFMLAACAPIRNNSDRSKADVIYRLLRENPTAVKGGIAV